MRRLKMYIKEGALLDWAVLAPQWWMLLSWGGGAPLPLQKARVLRLSRVRRGFAVRSSVRNTALLRLYADTWTCFVAQFARPHVSPKRPIC